MVFLYCLKKVLLLIFVNSFNTQSAKRSNKSNLSRDNCLILRHAKITIKLNSFKEAGDIKAYKYNEEKIIQWLETRVRALANVLRDKNIHVTSGAASATFIYSSFTTVDEELYLKYAFGIVSEYLDDYFSTQLEKHFNFTADIIECIGNKRKTEEANINEVSKKIKCEPNGQEENSFNVTSPEVKIQKTLTAKEKARQKAASGSKTISAFFTKK